MATKSQQVVEVVETEAFDTVNYLKWAPLSVGVHLLWGVHPVVSRYLQVYSDPPVDGLVLVAAATWLAVLVLTVHTWATGENANTKPWTARKARLAATFGCVAAVRVATNILSTKYAYAYVTQIVAMGAPFIVAVMSRTILGEVLPRCLGPALVASALGCVLVQLSYILDSGGLLQGGKTQLVGAAIQFVSVLFSSGARILMKSTSDVLTKSELIRTQHLTVAIPVTLATVSLAPEKWADFFRALQHPAALLSFLTLSVAIFWLAGVVQIFVLRQLGPATHSSLAPLRLFSTVVGTYAVLHEPLGQQAASAAVGWAGLATVVGTLVVFAAINTGKLPWPLVLGGKPAAPAYSKLEMAGGGEGDEDEDVL